MRVETFACPECGAEVVPTAAPGLRVQCPGCATLVEIPFLPRTLERRRSAHRRPLWVALTAAGVALTVLLATLLTIAVVRGRVVRQRQTELTRLLEEARAAEARGDLSSAIAGAEAARSYARRGQLALPDDFPTWREALACREAESRLALARSLIASDPGRARGLLLTLRDVVKTDPAVAMFAGPVVAALDEARVAEAHALLDAGNVAHQQGRPALAMERVAQARRLADELDSPHAAGIHRDADAITLRVVQARGVRVDPPSGAFVLGDPDAYREALIAPVIRDLNSRGYLVLEGALATGPIAAQAAYALALTIRETPLPYLKTPHRACELTAKLALTHRGSPWWSATVLGQTRMPLPGLTAAESGRYRAATAPLREAEDRFFRDALQTATAALPARLRNLPAPAPSP